MGKPDLKDFRRLEPLSDNQRQILRKLGYQFETFRHEEWNPDFLSTKVIYYVRFRTWTRITPANQTYIELLLS